MPKIRFLENDCKIRSSIVLQSKLEMVCVKCMSKVYRNFWWTWPRNSCSLRWTVPVNILRADDRSSYWEPQNHILNVKVVWEAESKTGTVISYREHQMNMFFLVFYFYIGGSLFSPPLWTDIFQNTLYKNEPSLFTS